VRVVKWLLTCGFTSPVLRPILGVVLDEVLQNRAVDGID
jgi:hypothetical protein